MSENKEKKPVTRQTRRYNVQVIEKLAVLHNCSIDFVRQSVRGDRNSETSETIRKDYKLLCEEVEVALNTLNK